MNKEKVQTAHKNSEASRDAAIDTLMGLGYTYWGAEQWEPPVTQPVKPVDPYLKLCPGIPSIGCNYTAICNQLCNKCGKVHHSHQLNIPAVAQVVQSAEKPTVEAIREANRLAILAEGRLHLLLSEYFKGLSGKEHHASDCATSNAPAHVPGTCDCTFGETK